jgi:hypothetical protein
MPMLASRSSRSVDALTGASLRYASTFMVVPTGVEKWHWVSRWGVRQTASKPA